MDQTDSDWQGWYDRHGPALLLFARQVTDSPAEAEDAVHDGFVRFWKRKATVDDPLAYMYRSVRHAALDRRRSDTRRERRELKLAQSSQASSPQPWREVARDELDQRLRDALGGLAESQREVVVMKLWGGLTFDQIAEATETARSTAAARYRSALKALRAALPVEELLP